MEQEVVEDPELPSLPLRDALNQLLERHVSEDDGQLAGLAVLLGNLDQKVDVAAKRGLDGVLRANHSRLELVVCFIPKSGSDS